MALFSQVDGPGAAEPEDLWDYVWSRVEGSGSEGAAAAAASTGSSSAANSGSSQYILPWDGCPRCKKASQVFVAQCDDLTWNEFWDKGYRNEEFSMRRQGQHPLTDAWPVTILVRCRCPGMQRPLTDAWPVTSLEEAFPPDGTASARWSAFY